MQYTFHLKPGITFQDGTKLDAKAFVETIARQLDKSSPIYIYNTGPVEGYEDFTFGPVESYRAVDDQTVEFKMKEPSAGFLNSLAMVWNGIVSPAAAAKYGKDFRNNPVGSGPFAFKEYRPRDQVVLTANENYWRGKPKVAGVVLQGHAGPAGGAAGDAAGRGAHPGRCRGGDRAGAAAGGEHQRGDAAGSGGVRRGAALRRQAIRRRAGAPRAEPGGGQGGDHQGAVFGPGGADDLAAAAGAMGVRPEHQGLWVRPGAGEEAAGGGRA